jgi:dTDP-4-amino-4,6-dideoxygalactose transaminase
MLKMAAQKERAMSAENSISFANPKAHLEAQRKEIETAIKNVLDSGWYILGKEVERFEQAFASFVGVRHCVGVANGTDAVALALRAAGVNAGDEVLTVSHSAVATVAAIEHAGATPVFVDIERNSRCMDPKSLAQRISEKSKAIVPVHIYGHPADMPAIMEIANERELLVVEDCAQELSVWPLRLAFIRQRISPR